MTRGLSGRLALGSETMERTMATLTGLFLGVFAGPVIGLLIQAVFIGHSSAGPEFNYMGDLESAAFIALGLLGGIILGPILGYAVSAKEGEDRLPAWLVMAALGLGLGVPFAAIVGFLLTLILGL